MKRGVAYARVSTTEQSKTSIEGQFASIENFAKQNNINIIDQFYDKESGTKLSREQFDIMLEKIFKFEYDVVLIEKHDRFTRAGLRGELIIEDIEKKGIPVVAVLEPVDTSNPFGSYFRGNILLLAKLERDIIAQRTKLRMGDCAKRGWWMGGNSPFGYKLAEIKDEEGRTRKTLEVDPERASIVKDIFMMRYEKKSYNAILEYLNTNNIKSVRGGTWSKSSLSDLIANPVYKGDYWYGKGSKHNHHKSKSEPIIMEDVFPAIVSKEIFDKVNTNIVRYKPVYHHKYLLKGLVVCGECGGRMVARGGKDNPTYVCSEWQNKKNTDYVGIAKKKLEDYVFVELKYKFLRQEVDFEATAATINYTNSLNNKIDHEKLIEYNVDLERINTEIKNVVNAIASGFGLKELKEKAESLEKERDEIIFKIDRLKDSDFKKVTPEELQEKWENIKRIFESSADEERETFFNQLLDKVVIYKDKKIDIHFKTDIL